MAAVGGAGEGGERGGELERTRYSPGARWPLRWLLFAMASPRGVGRGQDAARQWWWWWWEGRSGVADVCTLFPHLGGHRPPSPRVGYIDLTHPFRKGLMAQLVRVLVLFPLVLGSILACVKFYFFINISKDTINIISNLLKVI